MKFALPLLAAERKLFVPAFRANLAFSSVCYQLVFSQLFTAELVGHDLKIVNKWGKTFDPAEVNSRGRPGVTTAAGTNKLTRGRGRVGQAA